MAKLTGKACWRCRVNSMTMSNLIATMGQVVRYGVVGVLNNLLGYLIYLFVTWLWLEPIVAVSLMYPIGAVTAYFGHAKYTFGYLGRTSQGIFRYIIAHLTGFGVNVALLFVLSDLLGYPHQLVQAVAIVTVAGILYLLFRYFVFAHPSQSL